MIGAPVGVLVDLLQKRVDTINRQADVAVIELLDGKLKRIVFGCN